MRSLAALALLAICALCLLPSAVNAQQSATCYNELDDSFLNKCRYQDPGFFTVVASYIMQFVNPRTLAIIVLFMIMSLPIFFFSSGSAAASPADGGSVTGGPRYLVTQGRLDAAVEHYRMVRWKLLNFLHRLCYPLVLDVALYGAFRQSRPCRCLIGGQMQHIGSIYGMPSGDSMSGAVFASYLFEAAPFHKIGSRVIAVLVVAMVCMERAVLGYHSIAQVTVGACLGVMLHIYSTRVPQFFIFVDAAVSFILGCVLLQVDSAMVYPDNSQNNLFSWFVWGLSFQAFVCIMIYRHFATSQRGLRGMWVSMFTVENVDPGEFGVLLDSMDKHGVGGGSSSGSSSAVALSNEDKSVFRRLGDTWWTLIAFTVLTVINVLATCISSWNLMTRAS